MTLNGYRKILAYLVTPTLKDDADIEWERRALSVLTDTARDNGGSQVCVILYVKYALWADYYTQKLTTLFVSILTKRLGCCWGNIATAAHQRCLLLRLFLENNAQEKHFVGAASAVELQN